MANQAAPSLLARVTRAATESLAAGTDDLESALRTLDHVRGQRDRATERCMKVAEALGTANAALAAATSDLAAERRLRQRAQADVLNLLSLLSGLPLGALVDAGLSTADLALIDRIEERWTKETP